MRILGIDPGLQKDGVEAHLQELLAGAPGSRLYVSGLMLATLGVTVNVVPSDTLWSAIAAARALSMPSVTSIRCIEAAISRLVLARSSTSVWRHWGLAIRFLYCRSPASAG